ncbi:MAG: prepilin-type N-terminal cleavage/methylation domain-containing protein [Desulforudis sp.]|nr:MAG: prepilin-type N-terminal cleavage/methylation domain-containing protein [Desulforudis sp.]
MFKRLRGQRGFTLIEMMIVIAVIAILAFALIPKSGLVRDTAKEAGVEANARTVQGIVEGMAHRYNTGAALRDAVVTRLGNDIVNPFTQGTGAFNGWDGGGKAVYLRSDLISGTSSAYVGMVWVQVPDAPGTITIRPFGRNGAPIPGVDLIVKW